MKNVKGDPYFTDPVRVFSFFSDVSSKFFIWALRTRV
jgi:hypothetical protein